MIYFHYHECWFPYCRVRPVKVLTMQRSFAADWPRVALYVFQSLIIVSGISRSQVKTFPLREVKMYAGWFAFEILMAHVFQISGNSFAPSWFLLDVICGQSFTLIADKYGVSKWLSASILFGITVVTYTHFPETEFTASPWQKLNGQYSPRTLAHTSIFFLSAWLSQGLIHIRKKIQSSRAVKVSLFTVVTFAGYQSIYTSGDIQCSVLFAMKRFSIWGSERKERCKNETWFYSLFYGVLSSISIVMIAPSSPVPLITWLGQRSLVPYIGHMYFIHSGLKGRVDKLYKGMPSLGISALHTTIPILLNISLSCFNFVLVPPKKSSLKRRESLLG